MVRDEEAEAIGPFQFAILVLSMVLLLGIAAEWVLEVPREVERLIFYIDNAVCVVFFVDFVTRLRAAPSKLAFRNGAGSTCSRACRRWRPCDGAAPSASCGWCAS